MEVNGRLIKMHKLYLKNVSPGCSFCCRNKCPLLEALEFKDLKNRHLSSLLPALLSLELIASLISCAWMYDPNYIKDRRLLKSMKRHRNSGAREGPFV